MMSAFSQYSPQGLLPQFPGMQAEFGQAGSGQQFPFSGQGNSFLQNPFSPSQFAPNPFGGGGGHAGANIATQQIVQALGQLAQQIAIQNAVAQQIGLAVHQLAHQLATQGLQGGYGGLSPQAQGWGANRQQTIQ